MAASLENRVAGTGRGIVLTLITTLSVAGIVLLAPILPLMKAHYADVPHIKFLVPIALTIPALVMVFLSAFAGFLADKFGRRQVLLWSMPVFAIVGTAPLYLQSFSLIILSRVGVGFAEAASITSSTTLIGDYFVDAKREWWLAAQTGLASLSATFLFILGGVFGDFWWRTPFATYGLSIVMMLPLFLLTWEPVYHKDVSAGGVFPWRQMTPLYVITIFASFVLRTQKKLSYSNRNRHYSMRLNVGLFAH